MTLESNSRSYIFKICLQLVMRTPLSFFLANPFIFDTVIAYGVYITTKVLEQSFDLGGLKVKV